MKRSKSYEKMANVCTFLKSTHIAYIVQQALEENIGCILQIGLNNNLCDNADHAHL